MTMNIARISYCTFLLLAFPAVAAAQALPAKDVVAHLQSQAIEKGKSPLGHWGTDPEDYSHWRTHSNRLIPVYTFGTKGAGQNVDLGSYIDENSPYRSEDSLKKIYGRLPDRTLNPSANYMDQTNIAGIQRAAAAAGKKYIFLFVFDGMDWQTTRAAAIYNQQKDTYTEGKGSGTHFQTYDANGTAQYGFMVTSPHNDGSTTDVNAQTVKNPGGKIPGGYDASAAGSTPWDTPTDPGYLIVKPADGSARHAFVDSAASAGSMVNGAKTYYNAIGVGPAGEQLSAVSHELQNDDWAVGVVTSVPISHATPGAAYAHNVSRKDFQDISRDMLGLPSISHPKSPLPGMDVVIGGGYGYDDAEADPSAAQGDNFQSGNLHLADSDLKAVSIKNGGQYVVATRKKGKDGGQQLQRAARNAATGGHRLLGYYGLGAYEGHIPYQTANGDFKPVKGIKKADPEIYTEADLLENPTLAEMTSAALTVMASRKSNFWLMVEAGDVDWANHDNNIDNSIGAVNSGDAAVKTITDWVEANSNWDETLLIVTSDHGHMLTLTDPQQLIGEATAASSK
jgi:alkaline phosphatase